MRKNLIGKNWIALDKRLVRFLPRDRKYTYLEALFSLTFDINNNNFGTINGYAKLWQWSRNKTKGFIYGLMNGLRTGEGHNVDKKGKRKGHEIRICYSNLGLLKDNSFVNNGQEKDRKKDTTIKNNLYKNNINERQKEIKSKNQEKEQSTELTDKGKKYLASLGIKEPK